MEGNNRGLGNSNNFDDVCGLIVVVSFFFIALVLVAEVTPPYSVNPQPSCIFSSFSH